MAIKGLNIADTVPNPMAVNSFSGTLFAVTKVNGSDPQEDGGVTFKCGVAMFYSETAYDAGKKPIPYLAEGVDLTLTKAEVEGTALHDTVYEKLKTHLEGSYTTVNVVND